MKERRMDIDVMVKRVNQFEQRIVALEQVVSPITPSPGQQDVISNILSRLTNIESVIASLAAAAPSKGS
jgi:hypothetical protein